MTTCPACAVSLRHLRRLCWAHQHQDARDISNTVRLSRQGVRERVLAAQRRS